MILMLVYLCGAMEYVMDLYTGDPGSKNDQTAFAMDLASKYPLESH